MRKIWFTLLCIMLVFSITACSGTNTVPNTSEEAPTTQENITPTETAPEQSAAPAAETVELQAVMTPETAAYIESAAAAANAIPASEYPESEKSDLWKFVEAEEYRTKLADLRSSVDAIFPTSENNYDDDGNLLSSMGIPYAYPMEEGHSITIFSPIRGMISRSVTDYGTIPAFQVAAAETNINVEFLTIGEDSAETQMSLMFASGEFTDMVSDFMYSYIGTNSSAYENELIIPLNDYLEDYSPNYSAWINSDERYLRAVSDEDGMIFAWYNLMPEVKPEGTSWVRTDLLDKFGIESPVTLAEYEDYFTRCVDDGLTATIYADSLTWASIGASAFDLPAINGAESFSFAAYHIGDTVHTAYQDDALKDYISLMHDWYEKGFFSQDLISLSGQSMDRRAQDELVVNGQVGYMVQGVDRYTNYLESASVENWDIEPSRNIVKSPDQITHFAVNDAISVSNGSIVVTTSCEDIEAACRYMDWFYSDMGIETMNYGPEGVTWNWSEDGQRREMTNALYDDIVYNENPGTAVMFYTGYLAWTSVTDPYSGMYYSKTDKGIEAIEMYYVNNDSDYYLNESLLSFTTEESEIINHDLADMTTYISENMAKFLVGEESMDEWDSFIDTLYQLGLETVLDTYQVAYDRYLAN